MTFGPGLESTAILLSKAQGGDASARDILADRYRAILMRWAHGRLPKSASGVMETQDAVQVALMRGFANLEQFTPRHEGAFLAYLRQILLNYIRDEARSGKRPPVKEELPLDLVDTSARSPLEELIGRESLSRYEEALAGLSKRQQEAVILRLELGLRYREIAEALGMSSVNAARLVVARAMIRLASVMRDEEHGPEL